MDQGPPNPPSSPRALLTVTDVAGRLNVAKTAVYAIITRAELSHFRVGRLVRVREDDLEAYLARCRVTPNSRSPRPYARYPQA